MLGALRFRVLRGDFATWDAPRVSVGTDVRSFRIHRDPSATYLRVTVAFPSEAALGADIGLTECSIKVTDATGKVLVDAVERLGIGTTGTLVKLPAGVVGPYTAEVTGDRSVSDPDTLDSDALLNDTVTFHMFQLRER